MALRLKELDRIEFSVLVNNEVDPISASPNPAVKYPGFFTGVPLIPLPEGSHRGDAKLEARMDSICCGAHGLSLVITAIAGDVSHTMLFDAGPEDSVFKTNASRMRLDAGAIERIQLSHWHRDHSGGMLSAIKLITGAKQLGQPPVVVDLHPDRPDFRGIDFNGTPVSMEADPSFEDMEARGGVISKSSAPHLVLDDMFAVSGEVPRVTEYEKGLRGGIRFNAATEEWEKDEMIKDERFLMCNLKGKGLVVFAGCSHPGIINICRNAVELGGSLPLFSIIGGFHLADGDPIKMQRTMDDVKKMDVKVLMPGHCTGWRFSFKIEQEMPGSYVPCFGGTKYTIEA
ncbi:hypothetical protein QQX98_000898 [Neonectria punicea]|uniref:Metallo-beta-lactamase domain-containing protein n=1 Tax=Neonectria punicea TaxID=979145 RepID=A0ABR1HSL4_9HYPO